ncbi:helix-turn-helix domain-containing protein [Micromonospora sp. STR1_7]|uniref:Helix-turn-helix domain-containing protein n=1 Tax=Micromonospora parastrephiae TaxID=2806101 RepID=A0ABS1XXH1_9ACTN|nr:helix-turn-helix transcriptional regulator [Micromonospora parastrephiae]MBM0233944.1 helix-turn-helix domain-containing protein [Micromonospora parastrephiae]
MDGDNPLGEFLRARRELIRPEEVGIGAGAGLRRVPGLRREEVALLAGISSDYYLRLEQGRDRNPSVQVLEALARVLRLDPDATAHLVRLGQEQGSRRSSRAAAARARTSQPEVVPPSIQQLITGWPSNPAYVQTRFFDLVAANSLATALSSNYAPGVNLLEAAFLDPAERTLRRDWDEMTAEGVAILRAHAGPNVNHPRLVELVGELSVRSERFRQLWARHDVQPQREHLLRLVHPQVGEIELHSNKLAIGGSDGLVLVVLHAEAGSPSAELLGILGSLAAGAQPTAHEDPARQAESG